MRAFGTTSDPRWSPLIVRQRSPIEQWRGRSATGDRSLLPVLVAAGIVGVFLVSAVRRAGGVQALRETSPTVALVIAGFAVFAIVVFALALHETPRGTIEWDGARVVMRSARAERELAAAGTGSVLRVRLTGSAVSGLHQFWLAPDGSVRADLAESLWDGDALLRCAAAARLPVTDVGEMTPYDLGQRFPNLMPRIGGVPANTPVTADVLKTVIRNEVMGGAGSRPMWHEPRLWAVGVMVVMAIVWKSVVGH